MRPIFFVRARNIYHQRSNVWSVKNRKWFSGVGVFFIPICSIQHTNIYMHTYTFLFITFREFIFAVIIITTFCGGPICANAANDV